jgi:hypothetical protein
VASESAGNNMQYAGAIVGKYSLIGEGWQSRE